MDVDLRELRYALTVRAEGGISPAARRLRIAQPALSQAVTRLERRLGFALFTRGRAGMRPTPEGDRYLDRARELVLGAERLSALGQRLRTGASPSDNLQRLRVAAAPTIAAGLLPAALSASSITLPDVRVVSEARQLARLREAELDLGVIRAWPQDASAPPAPSAPSAPSAPPARAGFDRVPAVTAGDLCWRPLPGEPLWLAVPAAHGLPPGPAMLDGIADLTLLSWPRDVAPQAHDAISRALARAEVRPHRAHPQSNDMDQLSLVACGAGAALVPRSTVTDAHGAPVDRPGLDVRPLADPLALSPLSVVHRADATAAVADAAGRLAGMLASVLDAMRMDAGVGSA